MYSRRLLLSLVVVLSLATIAAADSAPVNTPLLHFETAIHYHSSLNGAVFAPTSAGFFENHAAGTKSNATITKIATYQPGEINFSLGRYGNIDYTAKGGGLTAPEPSSLMLLATGLLWMAGTVRRKLLRG